VLETLIYVKHETDVRLEITTLLIPSLNDSADELRKISEWIVTELGPDVPLHFSAFHPDYKLRELPNTPQKTLTTARKITMDAGVKYVFTGNVHNALIAMNAARNLLVDTGINWVSGISMLRRSPKGIVIIVAPFVLDSLKMNPATGERNVHE